MKRLPLVEAKGLSKVFKNGSKAFQAVSSFSLSIYPGEIVGLAGESGCGKSTVGKLLTRLIQPSAGSIYLDGHTLYPHASVSAKTICRQMQMVFQNPYASLNPSMTLQQILQEPLDIHRLALGEKQQRIHQLIELVGLHSEHLGLYPYSFSGGQRQRISIARALAVEPRFIVCDEPLSALDVSVQSQIISLLKKLQTELGLAYLFISHDLLVLRYLADRIGVMYAGHLVEIGSSDTIYHHPQHPYTKKLRAAVLSIDFLENKQVDDKDELEIRRSFETEGCPFYDRCPLAQPICRQHKPELQEIESNHFVACHFVQKNQKIETPCDKF